MLYLVDASVFIFRAYYSVPVEIADPDGNPVNALHGFARFLRAGYVNARIRLGGTARDLGKRGRQFGGSLEMPGSVKRARTVPAAGQYDVELL